MKVKYLLEILRHAKLEDDIVIGEIGKDHSPIEVKEINLVVGEVILSH